MQRLKFSSACEFNVFKQVIRGPFNPVAQPKAAFKSTISIVRSANSYVVFSALTKEDTVRSVISSDHNALGYHSQEDFEIEYRFNEQLKAFEAVVKPRIVYTLSEDISLPEAPDNKSKIFLDFISDEFERLKIRAEKIFLTALNVEEIHYYDSRNLQYLRKIFHDSPIYFNALCTRPEAKSQPGDLHVIYALNLFVIAVLYFILSFF
jgi:hypothetical protein